MTNDQEEHRGANISSRFAKIFVRFHVRTLFHLPAGYETRLYHKRITGHPVCTIPPLIKSEMSVYKLCSSALHRPDRLRPTFDLRGRDAGRGWENKKRRTRKRKRVVTLVAYIRTQLSPSLSPPLSLRLTAAHADTRQRLRRDVNGS